MNNSKKHQLAVAKEYLTGNSGETVAMAVEDIATGKWNLEREGEKSTVLAVTRLETYWRIAVFQGVIDEWLTEQKLDRITVVKALRNVGNVSPELREMAVGYANQVRYVLQGEAPDVHDLERELGVTGAMTFLRMRSHSDMGGVLHPTEDQERIEKLRSSLSVGQEAFVLRNHDAKKSLAKVLAIPAAGETLYGMAILEYVDNKTGKLTTDQPQLAVPLQALEPVNTENRKEFFESEANTYAASSDQWNKFARPGLDRRQTPLGIDVSKEYLRGLKYSEVYGLAEEHLSVVYSYVEDAQFFDIAHTELIDQRTPLSGDSKRKIYWLEKFNREDSHTDERALLSADLLALWNYDQAKKLGYEGEVSLSQMLLAPTKHEAELKEAYGEEIGQLIAANADKITDTFRHLRLPYPINMPERLRWEAA